MFTTGAGSNPTKNLPGSCIFQIKSEIRQERCRPRERHDERPVSLHSIKAHLHSWSLAKTCCCIALIRLCQHSFYSTQSPSTRPVTSSAGQTAPLCVLIEPESHKQMCRSIHLLCSRTSITFCICVALQ